MTQQLIYDLPKVKLRFKTAPSQSDQGKYTEHIAHFKEYNAGPSIFLERLKMGKQIKQSYLRFRRKKKNNYIKKNESQKKNSQLAEFNRYTTTAVRQKPKSLTNNFELTLQNAEERFDSLKTPCCRRSKIRFREQMAFIDLKEIQQQIRKTPNKQIYSSEFASLYKSLLKMNEKINTSIELQGTKCNYGLLQNDKRKIGELLRSKQLNFRSKLSRGIASNSFKIEAWKQDKTKYKQRDYYENLELQE